jgi:hypothetical protein
MGALSVRYEAVCQPPNKQLERTVKRRCGRAAAQLRRYAAELGDLSTLGSTVMRRSRAAVAALLVVGFLVGCQAVAQQTPQILVYSTYFEADGMRFESIEALRDYLANAPHDFYSIFFRDCAAKGREEELTRVIFGVLFERRARRGEEGPVNLGVGSIPCP